MNTVIEKVKTGFRLLFRQPSALVIALGQYGLFNILSDKTMLKLVYRAEMKRKLNLDVPTSFSEKLQWLKLYDRQPRYTQMVDKYAVRDVISQKFGEELLIPLIGKYDRAEDIDWESLPERFVIKCTHGSGCNIVCQRKSDINRDDALKQLKTWMKKNWFSFGREWPYKAVKPRIIIEEYMTDGLQGKDLTDYKFYCFEGKPTYCQVIGGRHKDGDKTLYYIDFFDQAWKIMPFSGMNTPGHPYPHSPITRSKPVSYEKMYKMASKLAEDTHFVRVDFYEIDGKPKFGEFTLYPLSGFGEFETEEWNLKLGKLIVLPTGNDYIHT